MRKKREWRGGEEVKVDGGDKNGEDTITIRVEILVGRREEEKKRMKRSQRWLTRRWQRDNNKHNDDN